MHRVSLIGVIVWIYHAFGTTAFITGHERRAVYENQLRELYSRNISQAVPPFSNSTEGLIPIDIFFDLHRVISLNSDSATLSISGALFVGWTDDRYAWSTGQDPDSVLLPAKYIWVPELTLTSSVDFDIQFGRTNDVDSVRMQRSGRATLERAVKADVACEMDVQYFPQDIQHCVIVFSPPATHRDIITLNSKPPRQIDPQQPAMGDEWRLLKCLHDFGTTTLTTANGNRVSVSAYHVNLLLHRNQAFYFTTIIVPSILLSFVILVPYVLPPSLSSQKIIIPVSVFLSFNIYMLLLEKSLPKSASIPVLGQTYATLLAIATITEFFQGISVKFYTCHIKHIPRPLAFLYFRVFATIFCYRTCHSISVIKTSTDLERQEQEEVKMAVKGWQTMGRINDRVGLFVSSTLMFVIFMYLLLSCYVSSPIPSSFIKDFNKS